MKIESAVLQFHPQCQFEKLQLTDLQKQYLGFLRNKSSIKELVQHYLKMGWLVHFQELYQLIEFLAEHHWLTNPEVKEYFSQLKLNSSSIVLKEFKPGAPSRRETDISRVQKFPFFRSLDPKLAQMLLQEAYFSMVPAQTLICKQGELERNLFVLIKGQAGVYKHEGGYRQLLATLVEETVFGESGFLLGDPRTADVIALKDSEVLVIPYRPDVLDPYIHRDKAEQLQIRFWVHHALKRSDFFNKFPSDCLDALAFAGRVVEIDSNRYLFQQGEVSQAAYVVIQGSLVIQQNGQNINVLNQGSIVGEISLLATQGVRTASAFSQRKSLLLEIHRDVFYALLSQNIYLAKELEVLAQQRLMKDNQRTAKVISS